MKILWTKTVLTGGLSIFVTSYGAAQTPQSALQPSLSTRQESFGLETSPDYYSISTGAGLVFKIRRTIPTSRIQSAGDIMSLVYKGVEYQAQDRGSHIASGFPIGTISAETIGADIIKITVASDSITHYYVARRGYPNIYMATYVTDKWTVGELRWISRLNENLLPNRPINSDLAGTSEGVESKDVYKKPDGITRSKYYGNDRAKDLTVRGVTGDGAGLFMVYGNRETSSGGPFFRDIQNQSAEVYNYMFSGHNQTEPIRYGLNGPYALVFTDGSTAKVPDMSWMDGLGFVGWISHSERGNVSGSSIGGRDSKYQYTVGFANDKAQYWTEASAKDGSFVAKGLKPGTYTLTIYKNELGVHTATVEVEAGKTTQLSALTVTADPSSTKQLWRIGDWDGTPTEFLNGDKLTIMHPTDVRMSDWKTGPYVIGSSTPTKDMPSYHVGAINSPRTVQFNLTKDQITDVTVRVGITAAYGGGRPTISLNEWNPRKAPGPSPQPKSRSMTIGTYRGVNSTYTFDIPASSLIEGINTLTVLPISGSGGWGFLSPSYSLDCIDIVPTAKP